MKLGMIISMLITLIGLTLLSILHERRLKGLEVTVIRLEEQTQNLRKSVHTYRIGIEENPDGSFTIRQVKIPKLKKP